MLVYRCCKVYHCCKVVTVMQNEEKCIIKLFFLKSSTGPTPFKIVTGVEFVSMPEYPREPPSSVTLMEWVDSLQNAWGNVKKALAKTTECQKKQADKKCIPQGEFHIGDKILSMKYLKLRLPSRKLGPKYIGPFPLVEVINLVTVELKLPKILGKVHPVFHCTIPAQGFNLRPIGKDVPGPIIVGGERHSEIKQTLDSRYYKGKLQYLVQWKGYPISRWIKAHNIKSERLIGRFHANYPQKLEPLHGGLQSK